MVSGRAFHVAGFEDQKLFFLEPATFKNLRLKAATLKA